MARQPWNILVNEIHDRALASVAARATGRLIDIGCGTKPYQQLFRPFVTEHVGLDHEHTLHGMDEVDLVGTAYEIPVPTASFDTVLCTAVLEHLEEPGRALTEARRVLKPGGIAIYSVPFIWHLHEEPRDFYRYSKYGLRYLFEQAGLTVEEIRPLSGFWVTFGQLFVYYVWRFNRGILRRLRVIVVLGYAIQGIAALLDRLDRAEQWTWMYLVVARAA